MPNLRPNRLRSIPRIHTPTFTWNPEGHPVGTLILTLPLPGRRVSPNATRGQSKKAAVIKSRHIKNHRTRARLITLAAIGDKIGVTFHGYTLHFHWPTAAYRDDDNADASFKSYRDGIAQALNIDDRHLRRLHLSTHQKDPTNPRLEIHLHPLSLP